MPASSTEQQTLWELAHKRLIIEWLRAEPQTQMNLNLNPKIFLYWLSDLGKVT